MLLQVAVFCFLILVAQAAPDLTLMDAQYLCSMTTSLTGFPASPQWNCNNNPASVVGTACTWTGVTCIVDTDMNVSYVSQINIAGTFQLTGNLPSDVFKLQMLATFNLVNHRLGSIPNGVSDAPALTKVVMQNCNLTGTVPNGFGNIETLTQLILKNNPLTGFIPGALGTPTFLSYLDLSQTQLTGTIPAELGNLKLTTLRLERTGIDAGCFPRDLALNGLLGNCDLSDSSFFCDCNAPPICNADTCCANVPGLAEAGLTCSDGGWTSDNATVMDLVIDLNNLFGTKTAVIHGDLYIERSLSALHGNLELDGRLTFLDGATLTMQANTSLKVSQRLTTNNATFQIIGYPNDLNGYGWTPVTAAQFQGRFGEVYLIDTNCYTPGLIWGATELNVNFTSIPCPSHLTTEQILAMIFAPLCIIGVIIFLVIIWARPEIISPDSDERVNMIPKGAEGSGKEFA